MLAFPDIDMETKTYRMAVQLSELPKDLWDIFTPKTVEDLRMLEVLLGMMAPWEEERESIILLQKGWGLPFRPNMTRAELDVRIRIEMLREKNANWSPGSGTEDESEDKEDDDELLL